MTPKEWADALDKHMVSREMLFELADFLRSLPEPTTDARRLQFACGVVNHTLDFSHRPLREEIAALLRSGGTYEGKTAKEWHDLRALDDGSFAWYESLIDGGNAWLSAGLAECARLRVLLNEQRRIANKAIRNSGDEADRAEKAEAERDAIRIGRDSAEEEARRLNRECAKFRAQLAAGAPRVEVRSGVGAERGLYVADKFILNDDGLPQHARGLIDTWAERLRAALNAPAAKAGPAETFGKLADALPINSDDEAWVDGLVQVKPSTYSRPLTRKARLDPAGTAKPKCGHVRLPISDPMTCNRALGHKGLHCSGDRRWNDDGVEYERVGWVVRRGKIRGQGRYLLRSWHLPKLRSWGSRFTDGAAVFVTKEEAEAMAEGGRVVSRWRKKK